MTLSKGCCLKLQTHTGGSGTHSPLQLFYAAAGGQTAQGQLMKGVRGCYTGFGNNVHAEYSALRGPGFTPDKNMSPHDGVVSRLATHLKLNPDLWAEYALREVTRWEHLAELYRYLELSPFNWALKKACISHLYPNAMRTDRGFLLAEEMLSWLRHNKVIFPSVEFIERTLAEAATPAPWLLAFSVHRLSLLQSIPHC